MKWDWETYDRDEYEYEAAAARRRMVGFAQKIEKCRLDYLEADDSTHLAECPSAQFEQYILDTYGIEYVMGKLEGQFGQRGIADFKIVDEQKFLMFNLKYA